MSQAISQQHPAVVLRSHYVHLRTLLAIAMIAVVGLTVAVLVLVTGNEAPAARTAAPVSSATVSTGTTRYDGGPEEGTRGAVVVHSAGTRYDGGPEEGTRGIGH
jgi:hypothetical protein